MSAPGLNWAACLKMTKVELELMTDQDMCIFIYRGSIGWVSAILKPYPKANNPLCKNDKKLPISWIKYFDANKLCMG